MLKVSTEQEKDRVVMRIEGKLIDPWTEELEAAWGDVATKLAGKKLLLDIRATTFIDQRGVELLQKIVRVSNAMMLADSPLTMQFARKVRQLGTDREGKE